jgi:CheY-like chemotaxis protein
MAVQRILIVDDNEDQGRTLQLLLEAPRRDVQYATNPLYALDLVKRWQPHVIFLDIGLPDLDGYQAARRFRKLLPGVRLYAITGYGTKADRQRALAAGFDDHLVKPADPATIERLL